MIILNRKIISRLNFSLNIIKELTRQSRIIFKLPIEKPTLVIDDEVKIACYYVGKGIIAISDDILNLNSEAKIRQILTHEFCHHIMYYIDEGKSTHGRQFKECCKIFGIPASSALAIRTKKGEKLK